MKFLFSSSLTKSYQASSQIVHSHRSTKYILYTTTTEALFGFLPNPSKNQGKLPPSPQSAEKEAKSRIATNRHTKGRSKNHSSKSKQKWKKENRFGLT
ncbi:hypothetical protein AAHA92_21990 [Salvia divinorum]|uniref:Uncharacterized protein n=1 Tax=Salvia divinorum TaxID=28513 RepID=A0ABD1GQC2_SALDI